MNMPFSGRFYTNEIQFHASEIKFHTNKIQFHQEENLISHFRKSIPNIHEIAGLPNSEQFLWYKLYPKILINIIFFSCSFLINNKINIYTHRHTYVYIYI